MKSQIKRLMSAKTLIVFAAGIGLASLCLKPATALARKPANSAKAELKSDLELDIEENGDLPPSRNETAATRASSHSSARSAGGDVESRIDLAQSQLDRRLYDEAISILRPMNDVLPRSGLLLLAKAYAGKRDSLSEIKTLELCIAKNPKDYIAQTAYGNALARAKRIEDAIAAYQEARKLNPRYRPAYEALLAKLEEKGERYEARNVVEDMRKYFGDQPALFTALCRLYSLDSYNEKSIEVCEKAIEKDSSVPENHVHLGMALMDRELIERAQNVLSSAGQRFPGSEPVQWALGELAMNKKDIVKAYGYYRRAAAANTKSVRAWVGLGSTAFKLQKTEEALAAFVKACKLDRQANKDFRLAIGELRVRKDRAMQAKFEIGINECQ